jgi:SSS family solute:Na+ symporter
MVITALGVAELGQDTFLPLSFFITSLTFGGLAGLFCVGFFSTRANSKGMTIGIILAVGVTIYLALSAQGEDLPTWLQIPEQYRSNTHPFLIGVFSNLATFVGGYFASFFFSRPPESKTRKATFWTLED